MMLSARALLNENQNPTDDEIEGSLSPVIYARCTGYTQIVEAVALAAAIERGDAPHIGQKPLRALLYLVDVIERSMVI